MFYAFEQVPRIYHGADEAETRCSSLNLAYRFNVSRLVVTRVISAWLVIMDVRLSLLISWPTRDVLHKTMPQCFIDSFGYKT